MGVQIVFVVIMLIFLIYWHIKNSDSKKVVTDYEEELKKQFDDENPEKN